MEDRGGKDRDENYIPFIFAEGATGVGLTRVHPAPTLGSMLILNGLDAYDSPVGLQS